MFSFSPKFKSPLLISVLLLTVITAQVRAQTTSFTYQGALNAGGSPANGTYDMQFKLYDALSGGSQIGSTVTVNVVTVANGLFKVTLDFGATAFPGADRFLEIGVRLGASTGAFTTLSPRQKTTSTPYAIRSLNATTADGISAACVNCVTSGQIAGLQGTKITGAIPVASVPAGSLDYIQNTTVQQAGANFNISGNGTAGGTLSGNILNAATQFNLNGNRVLSAPAGTENLFAGFRTGLTNTGGYNSFFGYEAGRANTAGGANSFFGHVAGFNNTTGYGNSFFGKNAGLSNTTGGSNSFFGWGAGGNNSTGHENSFFGVSAGGSNTTGFYNSFYGQLAGNKNLEGFENTFIGQSSGYSNTSGSNNSFVGRASGYTNTTGSFNSFFGHGSGYSNTTSNENSFFGFSAGYNNTTGFDNSYFGSGAGFYGTTGFGNSFFGKYAGYNNTAGKRNVMIGFSADFRSAPVTYSGSVGGDDNLFIGYQSGGISTRRNAAAIGNYAFVACDDCMVLGSSAVSALKVGIGTNAPTSKLTVAGLIETTSGGVKFPDGTTQTSAASGKVASVTAELPLVSTGGTNPSIILLNPVPVDRGGTGLSSAGTAGRFLRSDGTKWASSLLQATDIPAGSPSYIQNTPLQQTGANFNIDGNGTARNLSAITVNATKQYNFSGSPLLSLPGLNFFAGVGAGLSYATGERNSFFGISAGYNHKNGIGNSFFGFEAGHDNSDGERNSFFGADAGFYNNGSDNTFFGYKSGFSTADSGNSFFGAEAGSESSDWIGHNNTGIGYRAKTGSNNLNYATAIGADARVYTSNQIQLGRFGTDTVSIGKLSLPSTLNHVCINGTVLSTCSDSLRYDSFRYKEGVLSWHNGLSLIQRLRPVTFTWKQSQEPDLGLIVEEVAEVEPLLVTRNSEGEIERVKYEQLNIVLINAIKEQQALIEQQQVILKQQQEQIERQQSRNIKLEEQLKRQQSEIEDLKRVVCLSHPESGICRTIR